MTGRMWRRLRRIEVPPPSDHERLRELARTLDAGDELSDDERSAAAAYLRRLAESPRALTALSARRGRPRSSIAPDLALDYPVQRELLGTATKARHNVADAWHVEDQTVKDAWTNWQYGAIHRLEALTVRRPEPRRELLEAISQDLREHRRRGR